MALRIEPVPTLCDNYTWLAICDRTAEAVVIDAPEEDPVVRRVEALGLRVTRILCTHHHLDHSGAAAALGARFGVPVVGHVSDAGRITGFTEGVEEGDRVPLGELELAVLHVPAHTRGHVAYVCEATPAVFCGDTLFGAGCGRLFEGDAEDMFAALGKLAALPPETLVCCGHEYTESNLRFAALVEPESEAVARRLEQVRARRARRVAAWHEASPEEMTVPSTLAEERATNPFLRAPDARELGRRRAWKDEL